MVTQLCDNTKHIPNKKKNEHFWKTQKTNQNITTDYFILLRRYIWYFDSNNYNDDVTLYFNLMEKIYIRYSNIVVFCFHKQTNEDLGKWIKATHRVWEATECGIKWDLCSLEIKCGDVSIRKGGSGTREVKQPSIRNPCVRHVYKLAPSTQLVTNHFTALQFWWFTKLS